MGKKYFPPKLLEECKYKITKKKIEDLITNDFDSIANPIANLVMNK